MHAKQQGKTRRRNRKPPRNGQALGNLSPEERRQYLRAWGMLTQTTRSER